MNDEIKSLIEKWYGKLISEKKFKNELTSLLSNAGEADKVKAYRFIVDAIDGMDMEPGLAWRGIRIYSANKLKEIDVILPDHIKNRIRVFADGGKSKNETACLSVLKGFEKAIAKNVITGNEKATVINRYIEKEGYLRDVETVPSDKTIEGWIDSYSTQFYSNNRSK